MPTILKDVEVEEISLVDRPANDRAVVAVYKRAGHVPAKRPLAKQDGWRPTGGQRFVKHLFSLAR